MEKYEDTDSLYKGQTQIKVEGTEGRKLVKAEIVSVNGIVESTDVVSEEVLEEPKEAIVLRGTKERPRTLAYGEFIVPSRGAITSRFGQRWSSHHSGIDIAVPRGTSIKAADGGAVIFAGWSGGYGKLIKIDHENGYITYYAHCDTITVKKGQRVARGETIGKVGSTGNATGPHLHFEVRKWSCGKSAGLPELVIQDRSSTGGREAKQGAVLCLKSQVLKHRTAPCLALIHYARQSLITYFLRNSTVPPAFLTEFTKPNSPEPFL